MVVICLWCMLLWIIFPAASLFLECKLLEGRYCHEYILKHSTEPEIMPDTECEHVDRGLSESRLTLVVQRVVTIVHFKALGWKWTTGEIRLRVSGTIYIGVVTDRRWRVGKLKGIVNLDVWTQWLLANIKTVFSFSPRKLRTVSLHKGIVKRRWDYWAKKLPNGTVDHGS